MSTNLYSAPVLRDKLILDYQFKVENEFLRKGVCPNCGKKELFTSAKEPKVVKCGRLNKCGYVAHVKELYPDYFASWSDRFKPTTENPNASADAYLRDGRGFDIEKIRGWYVQENYYSHELEIGSATVRFPLPGIGHWERIIDRPERFGSRKATFKGDYRGAWWQPPGLSLTGVKELWITEGIFDAIALHHCGIAAVSALSCTNYPEAALSALAEQYPIGRPELVFAYDSDPAGVRYTKQHVKRAIEQGWKASAAQAPQKGRVKLDWNDLHQRDRLTQKDLKDYRYYGSLLLAETPEEKGKLIYSRHGWSSFSFDFDKRLYWWKIDHDKLEKSKQSIENENEDLSSEEVREKALNNSEYVVEICNCLPTPLYYLKNEITDESWYYFRIEFPHGGPSVKNTFTAGQLASASDFKKRLLHSGAGAIWRGTGGQLDSLLSRWTYNIKTVQTIDYTGYSIEHGCYVYNNVAVQGERIVELNEEDYFDLGKLSIKSLSRSLRLDLNPDPKAEQADWFDRFYLCFGSRGVVVLAAWFGCLFAEQIRARFESFPFIEIVGEADAGKSTLLQTLWKLFGRNHYEGSDPMKGSNVGFLRTMAQVSNLPVVLLESDREDDGDSSKGRPKQAFHWDSLKSLYNGGSLRTTGVKSSGNDTYDPQFRGALVISQNAPVQASTPIMERIVHVWMDKRHKSDAGRDAALELGRMSAGEMSGFLLKSIVREKAVLGLIEERLRTYELEVGSKGVRSQRIQKNHALFMVCVDALSMVCPIPQSVQVEAKQALTDMAIERERQLAKDHPLIEAFWDAYEYLNNADEDDELSERRLNHSRDPGLIAVNLNHFIQVAAERKQQVPPLTELKRLLRNSRRPKFLDIRTVNSAINAHWNARADASNRRPSTIKCWVFQR